MNRSQIRKKRQPLERDRLFSRRVNGEIAFSEVKEVLALRLVGLQTEATATQYQYPPPE
ncbi:protein of unknown function [Kyrpidia spormannii]|uniref:Uncharacterized protein n=2 Tax=Kyrpidia spormannii TaxID=2055160 RepID=A0ACA8Z5Z5_9BACL|nr:protein of unknown function [Kyrpidia spormannii]CAB3390112.1 protein of unknown function [Kyrpidia spormannii]